MKPVIVFAAAAAALLGGSALAQPRDQTTSICLDPAGHTLPVTCRGQDASRIHQVEDICQCLNGGLQVTVSICPSGVRPPPDSADFERDRYAAVKHGSLVGATWRGRPICVDRRNSPSD